MKIEKIRRTGISSMRFEFPIIIAIIITLSCNSQGDPCNEFPAKYIYNLDDNDLAPLSIYEYGANRFSPSSLDLRDAYIEAFGNESLVDITGSFIGTVTLISDSKGELRLEIQNFGDTTVTVNYMPTSPGYFTMTINNSPEPVALIGISDDCKLLNRCAYFLMYKRNDEWIGPEITVCLETSELDLVEILNNNTTWNQGDLLLISQFNQNFILD